MQLQFITFKNGSEVNIIHILARDIYSKEVKIELLENQGE